MCTSIVLSQARKSTDAMFLSFFQCGSAEQWVEKRHSVTVHPQAVYVGPRTQTCDAIHTRETILAKLRVYRQGIALCEQEEPFLNIESLFIMNQATL